MRVAPLLIVCASLLGASALDTARAAPAELKAGLASRVVNPSRPAAIIGHRCMKLFDKAYADLRVDALVVEDEQGKRLAWLGADFCIVPHAVVDRIKQLIQQRHGIDPAAVCVNASHTHSAPPLSEAEAVLPEHWDARYARFVVDQAVAAVGEAIGKLAPARLRYVEDTCKVGINRRTGEPGHVSMRPNPKGVVDHRAQVVTVESPDGKELRGLVVKYACHPVTTGGIGLGSDYPGFMRKIVEARHPGAVVVFLQGCGANVRIRVVNDDMTGWVRGTVETAEGFGRELAEAVERALRKPGSPIGGPIAAECVEIELPIRVLPDEKYREAAVRADAFSGNWGKRFARMIALGEKIPDRWPYRIQAFRLGGGPSPFTVVALDGEVFTEYGLNLGRALAPAGVMVLGYSNGVVTYLPTAKALHDGGYEPNAYTYFGVPGPYEPQVEKIVLDKAAELARPTLRSTDLFLRTSTAASKASQPMTLSSAPYVKLDGP